MRQAEILINNIVAGHLTEDENGFTFVYSPNYLTSGSPKPVSLTLPLQEKPFNQNTMFSFFDGLIPEGWLLAIAEKNWKLNERDRMGLLLACCNDCIGVVSVNDITPEDHV